jgi:serine/threonine protein kinase
MESDFWDHIERILIKGKISEIYRRDFRGARVYITKDNVYKIQIKSPSYKCAPFYQDLIEEAEILRFLDSQKGVVKIVNTISKNEYAAIVLKRISGINLAEYRFDSAFSFIKCMFAMITITLRLSFRGVVHGDLAIHNFIIDSKGAVYISDFGRARKVGVMRAFVGNTLVRLDRNDFPVLGALVRLLEFRLPIKYRGYYRSILRLRPYTDNLRLHESNIK